VTVITRTSRRLLISFGAFDSPALALDAKPATKEALQRGLVWRSCQSRSAMAEELVERAVAAARRMMAR